MYMFIERACIVHQAHGSQYWQDNRDLSLLRLVNCAKVHGIAVRVRKPNTSRVTIEVPPFLKAGSKKKALHPVWKIRRTAHVAESGSSSDLRSAYSDDADAYDGALPPMEILSSSRMVTATRIAT